MNDQYNLNHQNRFHLYKEMLKKEPRLWKKKHHIIKMILNSFAINLSIYGIYKVYYSFYNPKLGFIDSMINSKKMKILFFSIILIDSGIYYLNYKFLHDYVYSEYYSDLSNKEFCLMYESLMRAYRMKNINKELI